METLRLVLRDAVLVEDAVSVLRSIDELVRIGAWSMTWQNPQRPVYRSVRSNATWRSVHGLEIARVRTGSIEYDLITVFTLPGVVEAVLGIAKDVLFDRSHRLEMNRIEEESAAAQERRNEETHQLNQVLAITDELRKKELHQLDVAERSLALKSAQRGRRAQSRELQTLSPTESSVSTYDPDDARDSRELARDLDIETNLDQLIFQRDLSNDGGVSDTSEEFRSHLRTARAYSDAVIAARRLYRTQRRSNPVESIHLLDD